MFKEGNKVKLNPAGIASWGSQAPDGMKGTVSVVKKGGSWSGNAFKKSKHTVTVIWDGGNSNCYPETALQLMSPNYFSEEKEISLQDLIDKVT